MAQKGNHTKLKIMQAAKKIFIQKGFIAVTMSDLCEATGLSRGGLYRHYSSIKEVFIDLLMSDKRDWEIEIEKAIAAGFSAKKMMSFYLEQTYDSILEEGRFSLAIYEYARSGQDDDGFLAERYVYAVEMMERVLEYGQSCGQFSDFDTRVEAEHMVIFIDGLKMAGAAIPLPPITVKQQLDTLLYKIKKE